MSTEITVRKNHRGCISLYCELLNYRRTSFSCQNVNGYQFWPLVCKRDNNVHAILYTTQSIAKTLGMMLCCHQGKPS